MCKSCNTDTISRRGFFSKATGALFTAGVLGVASVTEASAKTELTPDAALAKLMDGNKKFVAAPELCEADMGNNRAAVAKGQSPWATVLTCADSRVSPELLFGGMGLGELFVCRNAGNVADDDVLGTIEYGAEHLGSPLIVVLGHERCGAVSAACDVAEKGTKLPGFIAKMVDAILPAAKSQLGKPGDFIDNTVIANAKAMAEKIGKESEIVSELVAEGKVKIVYGRYDLDTGAVELLG